jgi:hypothetical protein
MDSIILLGLKSYREDGKFIENETGNELTEDEAIDVVLEAWRDMLIGYYSWDLEKIIFKCCDTDECKEFCEII